MASLHRNDVTDALAAMAGGIVPPPDVVKHNEIDPKLDPEVQTDKEQVKIIGCRECARPLVVTTFFAAAKGICRVCKGEAGDTASVAQPVPGQTDPAKAQDLEKVLVNPTFARAICPMHPDDESHVMEMKHVNHNENYGPSQMIGYEQGKPVYRQLAVGETVLHQCLACKATVIYSTTAQSQFKRINEVRQGKNMQATERALGVRPEPVAA